MTFDDMLLEPAPGVMAAARRDWRWYAPSWAFPLLVLLVWHVSKTNGEAEPGQISTVLLWVYQFAAFGLAVSLRFLGRATTGQVFVLAMVVPVGVWAAAVLVRGAILAMMGRLDLA